MYDASKIKFWEISKRIFLRYFPIFVLFNINGSIAYWLMNLRPQEFGLIDRFIEANVGMVIWYFLLTLPLYALKPAKWYTRTGILTITMLVLVTFTAARTAASGVVPIPFIGWLIVPLPFFFLLTKGIYLVWLYLIEERQYISEKRIQEERAGRIENEKRVMESHLKLLQAQIEPHFLFNTLTSIVSLDDTDPQNAKIMQQNFIQYLKATLIKTRASITTVAQEIEVIRAFLDIFKARMGDRLKYKIDVSDEIKDLPFPSMLIQPIVENAIKHGIEPKIEGGEISIHAAKKGELLRWEIYDTGLGISEKSNLGVGLSNIIERIESLYESAGQLIMEENRPSGLKVIVEVPYV